MFKPYVVTISSEKGGVGKTTLATNLAIYLKALNEELPVTLFSFDNHFSVDRMFQIGGASSRGSVLDLLTGQNPEDLVETGEYGVQFIASSRNLGKLRERIKMTDVLARILAASQLQGIIIIDTRPDLDIFTQNALFASDRVIVPVKDAPSLENCKNLYDFFDHCGISRRPLRILPCLVDSRIHFDGPFKNSYQLLKAYAINRGYRCLEGYVAKSPKVESLNTNPEGKIYPVITHGRGTEVHIQLTHLARQIYVGALSKQERRLEQVGQQIAYLQEKYDEAFAGRLQKVKADCLICGKSLINEKAIAPAEYYCETSDGSVSGYLEGECFCQMVFKHFYQSQREVGHGDPLWDLFQESSQRSYFVLRLSSPSADLDNQEITLYRFDEEGIEVSRKTVKLKESENHFLKKERSTLHVLASRTLFTEGDGAKPFLLIRRVESSSPERILHDNSYGQFSVVAEKIAEQFSRPE